MPGMTAEDYVSRVPQLSPPHCPEILNETLSMKFLVSQELGRQRGQS